MEVLIHFLWLLIILIYLAVAYVSIGISLKRDKSVEDSERGWLFLFAPVLFPIWLAVTISATIGRWLK